METVIMVLPIVGIWYFSQLIVYFCAQLELLVGMIKEGTAIAIMRNGTFYKMKMRYTGWDFKGHLKGKSDETDNLGIYEIIPLPNKKASPTLWSSLSNIIFPIKGVSWIGIPPHFKIHHYQFEWTDDRFPKEPRKEVMHWILLKTYPYGITLENIELEGGIPYTIKLLVPMRITNPAIALFRVQRWFDATKDQISGWVRDEFSNLSADDFLAPTKDGEISRTRVGKNLKEAIDKILRDAKREIPPLYGVSVESIQIVSIDPSSNEMREITVKKERAKKEAEAAIEKARGEAEAINIVNAAAEKMSDKALTLEGFKAIKEAGANVTIIGKDINLAPMILGTTPTSTPNPKNKENKGGEK